ncbi:MAG: acyltransferase [Gammaproteobacteria bacterium]|nr:MAG: acyltransferase [Gammaproteobacteria bacterium]
MKMMRKIMTSPLIIASVQMTSCANFQSNIDTALSLIDDAALAGANIIVLPEYFAFMGIKETDKFDHMETAHTGIMQKAMSESAKKNNVWLVAGTHPIESEDKLRPFGRCYVFQPDGTVNCWYDKIHLFDVEVEDNTKSYCESKYSKAGESPVTFDTPWGKIGLAVCYDLRFPELFRKMALDGCEIFIMPAAFTHTTGRAHWEVLIRARAIENQCYFVASAQSGKHENGRETWGQSMIVSHTGEILAELKEGSGVVLHSIDRGMQKQSRIDFPVLTHTKIVN